MAALAAAIACSAVVAFYHFGGSEEQVSASKQSKPLLGKPSVMEAWEAMMKEHNMTFAGKLSDEERMSLRKLIQPEDRELQQTDRPGGYPASCVINSAIAIFKLMQAGTTVAQAAESSCHIYGFYEGAPGDGDSYDCAVDA
jgi:hypothetical protein